MPLRKSQPSLSVSTGHKLHKRSKSTNDRVDPDLYPLSASIKVSRRRPASDPPFATRYRSHSFSAEISTPPQARPQKESDNRSSTYTRDSLCDSLYEPSFTIPSPIALRREKMARVCKLLGEGVPVDLVFPPAETETEEHDLVMDIRAPSPEPKDEVPPPLPPKAEDWRRLSYRASNNSTSSSAPMLPTINETNGPRSSCSSTSSVDSDFSFLTSTTSSSYRFRRSSNMSPTSTAATSHGHSAVSHSQEQKVETVEQELGSEEEEDAFTSAYRAHPIHEISATHGRREFAVYVPYVPFVRRRSGLGSSGLSEKRMTHEFDIVHGVAELRV